MKKENIYKFLYLLSALVFLGFIIRIGTDYYKETIITSLLIERMIDYLIPAFVLLVAAIIIKKKYNKK